MCDAFHSTYSKCNEMLLVGQFCYCLLSWTCKRSQMLGRPISISELTLQGKLDTEKLLTDKGITFTSVRPVYIYGPLNYNPVEEWFFHRIKAGRPIPVPNSGQQVSHTMFTIIIHST